MAKQPSARTTRPQTTTPGTLGTEDHALLQQIRAFFERFNRVLDLLCSQPATSHPLRRRTDILAYGTANDTAQQETTIDQPATKAVWAAPHPSPIGHKGARVIYRPVRRTYRGRMIQPDLSGLQQVVQQVYAAVAKSPGSSTDRYVSITRMNRNTVRYALQILRQRKLIESAPIGE